MSIKMNDHNMSQKSKEYLERLTAPLNVDIVPTMELVDELNLNIEELEENAQNAQTEASDANEELETLIEKIKDVVAWLETQRTTCIEADMIDVVDVIKELEAII